MGNMLRGFFDELIREYRLEVKELDLEYPFNRSEYQRLHQSLRRAAIHERAKLGRELTRGELERLGLKVLKRER